MHENRTHDGGPMVTARELRSKTTGAWRELARCRGIDPDVFHPVDPDNGDEAKAICALCPVRGVCLEHALAVREKHGVWGGLTERERRRLIRQRRRSA